MAYAPNAYNYQVGIIFGILVLALLLLAGVLGAIYFICVINMRKKKEILRPPSAKNRNGGNIWLPSQHQNLQYPQAIQNNNQTACEYSRSQPSPYSAAAATTYNQQQDSKIRDIQPELTYKQGPIAWNETTPNHTQDIVNYETRSAPIVGYHMSSV